MAKFIDGFDLEQRVEVLSRTIQIYKRLKVRGSLSGSLVRAYQDLFQVDQQTGANSLEQLSIGSLCELARVNHDYEALNLTRELSQSNLLDIEHTLLMKHIDSFQRLTQVQISMLVHAFAKHGLQSEVLYLLEPHVLKQL